MEFEKRGYGCAKTLPAAPLLAVGAVGPPAAATPPASDLSYAATDCWTKAPRGL